MLIIIDPNGVISEVPAKEPIDQAISALFDPGAVLDVDQDFTSYQGQRCRAYLDDEAALKGAPANRAASDLRDASIDQPIKPHEPIHGRVVVVLRPKKPYKGR